jgi:hypothetical protein
MYTTGAKHTVPRNRVSYPELPQEPAPATQNYPWNLPKISREIPQEAAPTIQKSSRIRNPPCVAENFPQNLSINPTFTISPLRLSSGFLPGPYTTVLISTFSGAFNSSTNRNFLRPGASSFGFLSESRTTSYSDLKLDLNHHYSD